MGGLFSLFFKEGLIQPRKPVVRQIKRLPLLPLRGMKLAEGRSQVHES